MNNNSANANGSIYLGEAKGGVGERVGKTSVIERLDSQDHAGNFNPCHKVQSSKITYDPRCHCHPKSYGYTLFGKA